MASISLTSTSFVNGGMLPPEFKNNSLCNEMNRSPQFAWTYSGLIPVYIEHFNLYVEDEDSSSGSSPNSKFLHWGVTNIHSSQTSISENGGWIPGAVILPTDYLTGDRVNGWNGPCAPLIQRNYRAWLEIKIKAEYAPYIWQENAPQDLIVRSNYLHFTDNANNKGHQAQTGDCGVTTCPPGYLNTGCACQEVIIAPALLQNTSHEVEDAAGYNRYVESGTRFYADADQYLFPLRGKNGVTGGIMGPDDAVLQDTDGIGVTLPYTLDDTSPLWKSTDEFTGRLNAVGVWTPDTVNQEWIGFSQCVMTETTRKYCIGVGGNSRVRIKLNGNMIARFDRDDCIAHYQFWHIIEITLNCGMNLIEIEGYVTSPATPILGFEIYQATIAQLQALATEIDLVTSGYVVAASSDRLGEYFNIGENSGYICPPGFAYNDCGDGNCVDVNYAQSSTTNCCWVIQNCDDEDETYAIKLDPNELTPLYGGNVYSFSNSEYLTGKCFKVIEQIVCVVPDIEYVTVGQNYNTTNCLVCHSVLQFSSCISPDGNIYIELAPGEPEPVVGQVYALSVGEGCYKYVGPSTQYPASFTNVLLVIQYRTEDCGVCGGCLAFANCDDSEEIVFVKLAEGEDNPDPSNIGDIYELAGDPSLARHCWKFEGYVDCIEAIQDVTIVSHKECKFCVNCIPYYLLTDCSNPDNTLYIFWSKDSAPLEENRVYIFSAVPGTCFKANLQFSPCEDITPEIIYNSSDILYDYDDCEDCLRPCYKLIDCGEYETVSTEQNLEIYSNKTIQWEDSEGVIRCALVLPYNCREESYTEVEVTPLACFNSCQECDPPAPPEPEFSLKARAVAPGYNIPSCSTDHTGTSCNNSDPCPCS